MIIQISKERLEEFKDIYYRHYDERLNDEDACERASKLVGLLEAIYTPIKNKKITNN